MSEYRTTGLWRVRCEIADGKERLILQVQERRVGNVYYSEDNSRWRDALTTDLAMPENQRMTENLRESWVDSTT